MCFTSLFERLLLLLFTVLIMQIFLVRLAGNVKGCYLKNALGLNVFIKHYLRRTANVRPLSFIFILYRLNLAQFIVWNRIDSSTYVHESSYNIRRQVIDTCTKNLNNLNHSPIWLFSHLLSP